MATKPKRTATSTTTAEPDLAPDIRFEWIAVAAYYLAEQRGFEAGHELEDWLQAEQQLDNENTETSD